MKLYLKECNKIITSVVYYIFIVLFMVNWCQNFYGVTKEEIDLANGGKAKEISFNRPLLVKPSEEDTFFGSKSVENPEKIMTGAAEALLREYKNNSYATYPLGYYKAVSLNESKQKRVLIILCEITGLTKKQLDDLPEDYFPAVNGTTIHFGASQTDRSGSFNIKIGSENIQPAKIDKTKKFVPQVTYDHFKELMSEMEKIIGEKGSKYSMGMMLTYFGITEMNYNEAMVEYQQTINEDKVTNGFARLFCDYTGQALGLYPVFLIVILWMKDRRYRMNELIFNKNISSAKFVLVRCLANITMILLPIILLSLESLIPLIEYGSKTGIPVDYFAFIKYILWWLLPTVMIVNALGMFFTLLTDTPIAILVQFMWWIIDRGTTGLSGDTSLLTLMVRHNSLRGYEVIQQNFEIICINRFCMTGLSIFLIVLSMWILSLKRKGKVNAANIYTRWFRFVKSKLPVVHKR